ncbi:MAG: hypothetical protein UE970_00350 [Catenibacillus sp.]|nr:hypothetical protein [Catenibacillus sp.]
MKKYVVRLINDENAVIDGEVFNAESEIKAFMLYIDRCQRLGIKKCIHDKYTIEEWLFD